MNRPSQVKAWIDREGRGGGSLQGVARMKRLVECVAHGVEGPDDHVVSGAPHFGMNAPTAPVHGGLNSGTVLIGAPDCVDGPRRGEEGLGRVEAERETGEVLGGDAEPVAREIAGDGLDAAARLGIYRHHVFATLTAALKATYPVVCRLVDERFFAYAADCYIREDPPAGPCLFEYGATWPQFLAGFPPCRPHPYLPDVARLEWAMNAALHAPNSAPLDRARLGAVPAEDLPRLTFRLDPSLSLLASPWPVDLIWRANQDGAGAEPAVDLSGGTVHLEVRRVGDDVTIRALDAVSYAFREALHAGHALERAAAVALAIDPCFDLTRAIHELIAAEILTGFPLSETAP